MSTSSRSERAATLSKEAAAGRSIINEWGLYPRQALAFYSKSTELLFGGASEGGKSFAGRFFLIAWCSAIPHLQCYIFRKYYGDVISNHMEGPTSFHVMLRQWKQDKLVTITENEIKFWNGSIIQLHGLLLNKDLEKHIGREKHVIWLDEAGQIPKHHIDGLRAWCRMPKQMKDALPKQLEKLYAHFSEQERRELFPRMFYTTNPEGPSLSYFRRKWIENRNPFDIWQAPDNEGGFIRQFIPSKVSDNPSADPIAQKRRLLPLGEARAKALIEGDWSAPAGDFFKEYNDDLHAVPNFIPPNHWFKFRTFDWGSAEPFAALWWCVSDGQEFTDENGNQRWFPRESLICYREWYGCDEEDPSKGIHLANELIAQGIVKRTQETTCGLTFSDNYPFADRGHKKNGTKWTMADDFRENGAPLTLGNTARIFGWKEIRSRLQGIEGIPMLYIQQSCTYLRTYLPALGYHETNSEDAQEDGEATHVCDAARLAHTVRPLVRDAEKITEPDYRDKNKRHTVNSIVSQLNQHNSTIPYVTRR